MKSYLSGYRLFVFVVAIGLLLTPPAWAANPMSPTKGPSDLQPLADLVQQYLKADSNLQIALKDKILAYPDVTVDKVMRTIRTGMAYDKQPVGVLPSQSIQVKGRTYSYGLFVPQGYDPSISYALILCLHGAGFNGDSYLDRWVPRLTEGYILVCPTISMGAWWTREGEELVMATFHRVMSQYHIDPDRVFLTGMSNGGIGAWIIGMHHAALFAGIAPMASGIDKVLYPFLDNLKQSSVYIIHGRQDQIMPVWLSRDLVNEMNARNITYVYREHTLSHPHAGGHFFPREELPGLVEWFDQQRRNPVPRQVTVIREATHLESFYWVRIDATDRIAAFSENLIDSQDEYITDGIFAKLQVEITEPNHLVVRTHRVRRFSLFLNDDLVDLALPVTVTTNGQISYQQKVHPSINTLLQQARVRKDPKALFPIQIVIDVAP